MNLMDQAVKLGTQTMMEQVTGIREEADYKVIVTTEKEYECKSIILATGVTHRHLGVPGEERLTGAGVSYCATCDGMFFRGREVAVVGGGSTALQDAEFLSNYCSKVYLIHRRDEFRGEDQIVKRLQEKENVEFILNTTVQEIRGEQMVESLRLLNKVTGEESELAVSGIFAFALAAILALLAYYFAFPLLNVEYEYSLLNHDLDIDAIYSKEKRKSKMNLDIQNAEIIAPKGSHRLDSYHPEATCDFSSGNANAKIFAIMIPINQKMTCVYIEPDENMIEHMKQWMGMKMFVD